RPAPGRSRPWPMAAAAAATATATADPGRILHQSGPVVRGIRQGLRGGRGGSAGAGAEHVDEGLAQLLERAVAHGDAGTPAFLGNGLGGHVVHPPHDLYLAELALLQALRIGPREAPLVRHLPVASSMAMAAWSTTPRPVWPPAAATAVSVSHIGDKLRDP